VKESLIVDVWILSHSLIILIDERVGVVVTLLVDVVVVVLGVRRVAGFLFFFLKVVIVWSEALTLLIV